MFGDYFDRLPRPGAQIGEGYEFGTNTGKQGTFDPTNAQQAHLAVQRLKSLEGSYGERLDTQFSGETGLLKNDGQGYADMLNARTEAANIRRLFGGQTPMNTRFGGTL